MAFKVSGTTVIDNSRNFTLVSLTATTLSGTGTSITNLNASNITAGTLSSARLGDIVGATGGYSTIVTNSNGWVVNYGNCNC